MKHLWTQLGGDQIIPNLLPMLTEVILIGGGLSLAVFLFRNRGRKRELARQLGNVLYDYASLSYNSLQSIYAVNQDDLENQFRARRVALKRFRDFVAEYSIILSDSEKTVCEQVSQSLSQLHSKITPNIDARDNRQLREELRSRFATKSTDPFAQMRKLNRMMTAELWSWSIRPFSKSRYIIPKQLATDCDGLIRAIANDASHETSGRDYPLRSEYSMEENHYTEQRFI